MLAGKLLLVFGVVSVLLGVWVLINGRFPPLASWVGRLPGDLSIERPTYRIYLPITTGMLASLILTLLPWYLSRRG